LCQHRGLDHAQKNAVAVFGLLQPSYGKSLMSTSSPWRQMNRRPAISGCKVRTKTAARHSGTPAATSRSQSTASTCCGATAERAPSISQSAIATISGRRMLLTFAFREATATGYARSATASTATGHANR